MRNVTEVLGTFLDLGGQPGDSAKVMRSGPVVLAGAFFAALLALPGCSLVLSFDDLKDAGPTADGGGGADGGATDGAGSDPYEPNDTSSQAPLIESGSFGPLPLSPSFDQDWFAFTLAEATDTTIDVLFAQSDVDIDVQLLIAGGDASPPSPIAGSTSIDDNERIERTTASGGNLPPGDYFIRVYSSLGEGSYTLVLAAP